MAMPRMCGIDGSKPWRSSGSGFLWSWRDWESERDGVAADQGWPLYLQRFADLTADKS